MLRQCVTCGKESDNKKDYFELSAKSVREIYAGSVLLN